MNPEILAAAQRIHERNMVYPAYVLGYNANRGDKNPFIFPKELNMRVIIASQPEILTQEQKLELKAIVEELDNSDWSKWTSGFYAKWNDVD